MEKKIGIYIWKPKNEDRYCVGEWNPSSKRYYNMSDEDAGRKRIYEEIHSKSGTSRYELENLDILYTKVLDFHNTNNRKKGFDKVIHNNLRDFFGNAVQIKNQKTKHYTEFFTNTAFKNFGDILKDAVEKTAADDWENFRPNRPYSFKPRQEQQQAIDKMLNAKNNGKEKFLLGAKCRFGKTITSYFFAEKAKFTNILIMSFRPNDTKDAWQQDLITHQTFSNYTFFDQKQLKKWQNCNTSKVLYMSFQKVQKDLIQIFQKIKGIDLLIIDEDHIGAHRKENRDLISKLNPQFKLMLTGTPEVELLSNEFSDDEYFRYDYIDEQERKEQELQDKNLTANARRIICESKPTLNLFAFDLSKKFEEQLFNNDYGFSLSEFFKIDNKTGKFTYEQYVVKFLSYLTFTADDLSEIDGLDVDLAIFNNINLNLSHGVWKLPSIKACKAMEILLKNHPGFKNSYHVEVLPESDKSPKLIEETCAKNQQTIWLTVMKNTVGVTVKSWTYTMSLYGNDNSSQTTYIQYIFRAGSSGKEEFYSFDFCPNRVLQVVSDMAQARVADKRCNNFNESFNTVLNYLNIFSYRGAGIFKKLDAQDVFKGISENITIMSCERLLIDEVSILKKDYLDEYDSSKVGSLGQEISLNEALKKLKKEFDNTQTKKQKKNSQAKNANKDFEKFVFQAFIDIYKWVKYHKGSINTIEDFVEKVHSKPYKGHYNDYFIYSEDFIEALLDLMQTSKKKNFAIAIERFSTLPFSYSIANVPQKYAEIMAKRFSNLNNIKYICDPTFSGPGLLQAVLEKVPGVTPIVVICDKIIKKFNLLPGRLETIAIKEIKGVVILNERNETFNYFLKRLKKDYGDEKMDIIMNPPYDGNLHLKILENVIKTVDKTPDTEVVCIAPDGWLTDPLVDFHTSTKYFQEMRETVQNKLCDDIYSIDPDEFNKEFGASSFFGVSITHYKKGQNFDIDRYKIKDPLTIKIMKKAHEMNSLMSKFTRRPEEDNELFVPVRRRTHHNPKYPFADYNSRAVDGIQFKTKEEAQNFIKSFDTWLYKWLDKFPLGEWSPKVPYLEDYTKPWTDDRLYELFDIKTPEEIQEIENKINGL